MIALYKICQNFSPIRKAAYSYAVRFIIQNLIANNSYECRYQQVSLTCPYTIRAIIFNNVLNDDRFRSIAANPNFAIVTNVIVSHDKTRRNHRYPRSII